MMKLPDEVAKELCDYLGHATFRQGLTKRDELIVRHCAKVCEAMTTKLYDHAKAPYLKCADAILRDFELKD